MSLKYNQYQKAVTKENESQSIQTCQVQNVLLYLGVFAGSSYLQFFEHISHNTNSHYTLTAKCSPPDEVGECIVTLILMKGYSLN